MFKNEFMAKMAFNSLQVIREYNEEDHIEIERLRNMELKSALKNII